MSAGAGAVLRGLRRASAPATSFVTPARTITESDLVSFSALTGDWHPQHADADVGSRAASSASGSRTGCWSSPTRSASSRSTPTGSSRCAAWTRVAFKRPVRIGDTIRVEGRLEETQADLAMSSALSPSFGGSSTRRKSSPFAPGSRCSGGAASESSRELRTGGPRRSTSDPRGPADPRHRGDQPPPARLRDRRTRPRAGGRGPAHQLRAGCGGSPSAPPGVAGPAGGAGVGRQPRRGLRRAGRPS